MDEFASRIDSKVDQRGRVAIPAPFRAILAQEGTSEIHCYPHLDYATIEAGGSRLVEEIKGIVGRQPTGSALREALELVYFGECEKLKIDPDGRTVLPKRLRDHAGITETAVFVGLGNKFQIWEPEAYSKFRERAREQALALRKELGAGSR
ncbi:division/cell wall cluster transcriptional repressor MraZ [Rhodomicrobium lacus]|jgi:MraZ protein|uniref:division/cell wall cluster transcriptional repressor MraZ n=1 Tax=Rhodomicrobium TaxID=1068 RepID=UPI000F8E0560|nr:division/cell wall cluster transcriptional repressor MraZ [Rhodomicrobium lacus]WKW52161.1 division/cell wall cluster transcriptional repressor MraZ [Rhodomicrobium lacus]